MDPYLESRWSDVHSTLITAIKEALQPAVPVGLRARSEERILLEEEHEPVRRDQSDVAVITVPAPRATAVVAGAPGVVPDPVLIDFPDGP